MSDLEYKVRAPLRLELQSGEVVGVHEWSQTGLTYPNTTDVLPKKGHLVIPFQGVDLRFDVTFTKGSGDQELLFKNLTGRQREVIAVFYRSILSGKMAASDDVITALDTPVDLVPMGETEEEKSAGKAKQKPRFLRIIWNICFYVILAGVLFGLIGGQIWTRLSSVHLHNARVVAPEIIHRAGGTAYVDEIYVTTGQQVEQGDRLVRLSDPERDGVVDDIRRDIERAADRTRSARKLWQDHLEAGNETRTRLLRAYRAAIAERRLSDFTSERNLKLVYESYRALLAFDAARNDANGGIHNVVRQLKRQLDDAKDVERRLKRDLSNAKSSARAYDVVARKDGVVTQLLTFEDVFLTRGTEVLVLEEKAPRFVQAWVDEVQAAAIFVGMPVEFAVRTAQGRRSLMGEISNITAGIDPETDNGFGMIVQVSIPGMDADTSRNELSAAAPVKARALKSWYTLKWPL